MRPTKPQVDPQQAERWAREVYGVAATASELPGEVDRNFLLEVQDGTRCVLKVASGETDPIRLECQIAALEHLGRTGLSLLVPRPVRDKGGATIRAARTVEDRPCLLRMVTFLDGAPMAKLGARKALLHRSVGRLLGRIDSELASFAHPGARLRLVWDLARVLELRPLADALDPDLRPLVVAGLDGFAKRVAPRLTELRTSVIHNDANDYNLLVDEGPDGRPNLRGLIDFGDLVHSITVAELAIACAYAMLDVDDPSAAAAEVTAGYEETLPLVELERELLPEMIAARLCASLLMAAQARRDSPRDRYLTISERPAADLLRKLSG